MSLKISPEKYSKVADLLKNYDRKVKNMETKELFQFLEQLKANLDWVVENVETRLFKVQQQEKKEAEREAKEAESDSESESEEESSESESSDESDSSDSESESETDESSESETEDAKPVSQTVSATKKNQ